MEQINSYFKLNIEGERAVLKIYPPSQGGTRLDFQEVSDSICHSTH